MSNNNHNTQTWQIHVFCQQNVTNNIIFCFLSYVSKNVTKCTATRSWWSLHAVCGLEWPAYILASQHTVHFLKHTSMLSICGKAYKQPHYLHFNHPNAYPLACKRLQPDKLWSFCQVISNIITSFYPDRHLCKVKISRLILDLFIL